MLITSSFSFVQTQQQQKLLPSLPTNAAFGGRVGGSTGAGVPGTGVASVGTGIASVGPGDDPGLCVDDGPGLDAGDAPGLRAGVASVGTGLGISSS